MIIKSFDNNKIKIIIDNFDLNKAGISTKHWISNSNQTISIIKNLIKSISTSINMEHNFSFKDYFIYTYNYQIFSIILFF